MVKTIGYVKLNHYLYHKGPYIYYFNENCVGINQFIVEKMQSWSKTYPSLNILEIHLNDFEKKIMNEYNKIYLYYDCQKVKELIEPKENDIKNIIYLCIDFHNKKIEALAENVGLGRNLIKRNDEKKKRCVSDIIIEKRDSCQIAKIKYILKQRIKIYDDCTNLFSENKYQIRKNIMHSGINFNNNAKKIVEPSKEKVNLIKIKMKNSKNYKFYLGKNPKCPNSETELNNLKLSKIKFKSYRKKVIKANNTNSSNICKPLMIDGTNTTNLSMNKSFTI